MFKNLSFLVMLKNIVDKFCYMIWRALVVFVNIDPIKSCAKFDNLYPT